MCVYSVYVTVHVYVFGYLHACYFGACSFYEVSFRVGLVSISDSGISVLLLNQ